MCTVLLPPGGYTIAVKIYRGADKSLARPGRKQINDSVRMAFDILRGADKSLARPGRKQAYVSVRMAFGI